MSAPPTAPASAPAYAIDGRPAARAEFYAAACDPRRSAVVEACAGAGKTWMLVSRILRALVDGAEPQQILAITFTRKAAGEMRGRLAQWLAEFAAASDEKRAEELVKRGMSPHDARAAAPRLGELHERVLASGRDVGVLTFHAWFAQLLANAPLATLRELGLPPGHELLEDPAPLRVPLMRRVYRRLQAEPALRLVYADLVARRGRAIVGQWIDAAWGRLPEITAAMQAGTLAGAVPAAASQWPECEGLETPLALIRSFEVKRELREMVRVCLAANGKIARDTGASLDAVLAADPAADAGQLFELAWDTLFTGEGDLRRKLPADPTVDRVADRLRRLARMRDQQEAHVDHVAMVAIATVLADEYAALKRERRLVDMGDLDAAAAALLGDSEASAWIQQRLDQRLRHLLIDEFQDTSPLQWRALSAWLAGYAGAGGGASGQRPLAVFIVGDPKQGIYGFRGADAAVFGAARDFVVEGLDGRALACDHTQRCAPGLVDGFNAVLAELARHTGWGGPYRSHTTESTRSGVLGVLPSVRRAKPPPRTERDGWRDSLTEPRREPEQQRRVDEAREVARAIGQLMAEQGLEPHQVMVLARRGDALADAAAALAEAGIPHALADKLVLTEVPEVLDVLAVLDVLVSPGHDLMLARALKSPIFGAADADLVALAQASRQPYTRHWLETLLRDESLDAAPLVRARGLFARWRGLVHRLPPHDLLDRIVDEARVMPRMAAAVPAARRAFALQAIEALVGAALSHGGARWASAYGFLRDVRAGRVQVRRPVPPRAVQLLTVHGAKGLEAEAVFVIDTGRASVVRTEPTLMLDWPAGAPAPHCAAFVRRPDKPPPSLEALAEQQAEREAREERNALYVALTRARRFLVMSRTEPLQTRGGETWWGLVTPLVAPTPAPWRAATPEPAAGVVAPPPTDRAEAANAAAFDAVAVPPSPIEIVALPSRQGLAAEPAPAPAPAPPAARSRDPVRDAAAARLGEALHRLLEWAGRPGEPLPRAAWPDACRTAARLFGLPGAEGELLARLQAVLGSPDVAPLFDPARVRWAGNEVPVAHEGESLRIDRLVQIGPAAGGGGEPEWWVLDYKLDRDPAARPEYRVQLARYAAAVRAAQPGEPVRAAFITGDGRLIEP